MTRETCIICFVGKKLRWQAFATAIGLPRNSKVEEKLAGSFFLFLLSLRACLHLSRSSIDAVPQPGDASRYFRTNPTLPNSTSPLPPSLSLSPSPPQQQINKDGSLRLRYHYSTNLNFNISSTFVCTRQQDFSIVGYRFDQPRKEMFLGIRKSFNWVDG